MRPDIAEYRKRLIVERLRRKVTQAELAEAIGVSQPHLSLIENEKRDLTVWRYNKIREYFDKIDREM